MVILYSLSGSSPSPPRSPLSLWSACLLLAACTLPPPDKAAPEADSGEVRADTASDDPLLSPELVVSPTVIGFGYTS